MAKLPNRAFGGLCCSCRKIFVFRRADENIRGVQTGEVISADDIDVLLPETWLSEQWSAFQTLLQAEGWRLIDAHEHTFEKRGVHCSFAALEELETFAGVPIPGIKTRA